MIRVYGRLTKLFLSFLFVLLLSLSLTVNSGDNVIRLATLSWPPYTDEAMPNKGFISEIVSAAFAAAGYQVKIHFIPWKRGLKDTKSGFYDALFPAYTSEDRRVTYAYSNQISAGELGLFAQKNRSIEYTKLTDLSPYKVGVVRGYVNTPEFDAADFLEKREANSDEQNLRKLIKGRIDLAVADRLTAIHLMNTRFPEGKSALQYLQPALEIKALYVVFSRSRSDVDNLTREFNGGLQMIRDNGTYDAIMARFTR